MTLLYANSGEPDQTQRFAASDLVLHCLPLSYKKDARLLWVKKMFAVTLLIIFQVGRHLILGGGGGSTNLIKVKMSKIRIFFYFSEMARKYFG